MGKRAATALRITATGVVLLALRQLVMALLRDRVLAELHSGSDAHAALFARLKLYSDISWALGALIAIVVHVAATITNRAIEWPDEIPFWAELLWWINGAALAAAIALPLFAVHRARPTHLSPCSDWRSGAGGH